MDALAWQAYRLKMPRYEAQNAWLPLLLDSYAMVDLSVHYAVENAGRTIACHEGCGACCQQMIPASTLEVFGIKFYLEHRINKKFHATLAHAHENPMLCIFNRDTKCSIYPMRPYACRRYIIANTCCLPNEDPTKTRPYDLVEPSREMFYEAIALTLPFYATQDLFPLEGEHIYDFYIRQNVILSSAYPQILGIDCQG